MDFHRLSREPQVPRLSSTYPSTADESRMPRLRALCSSTEGRRPAMEDIWGPQECCDDFLSHSSQKRSVECLLSYILLLILFQDNEYFVAVAR